MTDTTTVPKVEPKYDLDYITTDSGNADRLVREHGEDFRYCDALGGWLHWNGVRWQVDNAAIWERAEQVGKEYLREAAEADDRQVANRLWQHGRYTLSERGMSRMIALADKDSRMRVGAELFDADPYLLNVQNGTIDICSGEFRPHNRTDLITKLAPITYDESASA